MKNSIRKSINQKYSVINISDLEVVTIIGMLEEEKITPQRLIVNFQVKFDSSPAAETDNIKDTIDYFELTKIVKDFIENSRFELLEKLADQALKIINQFSDKIIDSTIEIKKPEALREFGAMVSFKTSSKK